MNRIGWMLVVGIMLGLLVGREAVESATRELVDTDSAQSLSNKTVAGVFPTGGIISFGGSSAPSGYLLCDGSAVSRTTYAALFAVLGTTYGTGDGSTTFNVPDLRGRSPLGSGQGSGLTNRALGASGGEETHTLSIGEMPSHSHVHGVPWYGSGNFTYNNPASGPAYRMTPHPDDGSGNVSTNATGSGNAHSVMDPFMVTNFIIKT